MYHGFISYSHASDERLASAFQRGLHRLSRPWYKLRALRIFRDKTSLAANPAMWPAIEKALSESKYFLLFASPAAAKSEGVQREVKWWLNNRSLEKLLVVFTDGELHWDNNQSDFDWKFTTALPSCLQGYYKNVPKYVDLRWARTDTNLSLRNLNFRKDVLDIAAPLHEKLKDDLDSDDHKQRRRTLCIAALGIIFVIGAAIVAIQQIFIAEEQGQVALSRELANAAGQEFSRNPSLAFLLAVQGIKVKPTIEARQSLLGNLQRLRKMMFVLHGHRGGIRDVVFSRDGKTLASISDEGQEVIFWDATRRERKGKPVIANQSILSIAFAPDNKTVAISGLDGSIVFFESDKMSESKPALMGHKLQVVSLDFSSTGKHLASASIDDTVILWDWVNRVKLAEVRGRCVTFSPDGTLLVTQHGADILLWNGETGVQIGSMLGDDVGDVCALAISPNGRLLASLAQENTLVLWDLAARNKVTSIRPAHAFIRKIAFSPDGKTIVTGDGKNGVVLRDARTLMPIEPSLEAHQDRVMAAEFSPDGKLLATGSRDRTVMLWEVASRTPLGVLLEKEPGTLTGIALSRDGRTVATTRPGKLRIWDVHSRTLLGVPLEGGKTFMSVAMNSTGDIVATGTADGKIVFWDILRRVAITESLDAHEGLVHSLAFSPDDKILASGGQDKRVILWNAASHTPVAPPLEKHRGGVKALAFSSDGDLLASAGFDNQVLLWNTKTREHLATLDGDSVAFSPDGKVVATTIGRTMAFWDRQGRRLPTSFEGESSRLWNLAYSPDGKFIAVAGDDGMIVWDVVSAKRLGRIAEAKHIFSLSTTTLVALARSEEVVLYTLDEKSWVRLACKIANRDLDAGERKQYFGEKTRIRTTCGDLADR